MPSLLYMQAVYNRISAKRKIKLCYLLSFLIIFHALPSLLHFKMIDTSPYPFHSILDILIGHCHSFTFSQTNSSGWQINPVALANTNILIIFNLICLIQRGGNRDTCFMNLLPLCYCWVSTWSLAVSIKFFKLKTLSGCWPNCQNPEKVDAHHTLSPHFILRPPATFQRTSPSPLL